MPGHTAQLNLTVLAIALLDGQLFGLFLVLTCFLVVTFRMQESQKNCNAAAIYIGHAIVCKLKMFDRFLCLDSSWYVKISSELLSGQNICPYSNHCTDGGLCSRHGLVIMLLDFTYYSP